LPRTGQSGSEDLALADSAGVPDPIASGVPSVVAPTPLRPHASAEGHAARVRPKRIFDGRGWTITCLAADAAAKLGYLLGERGPDVLDARGIPAQFVAPDGTVVENRGWSTAVEEPACT